MVALRDLSPKGVSCLLNRHGKGQIHRKSSAEDRTLKFYTNFILHEALLQRCELGWNWTMRDSLALGLRPFICWHWPVPFKQSTENIQNSVPGHQARSLFTFQLYGSFKRVQSTCKPVWFYLRNTGPRDKKYKLVMMHLSIIYSLGDKTETRTWGSLVQSSSNQLARLGHNSDFKSAELSWFSVQLKCCEGSAALIKP